jgi:tetratricopeptide (TPR) repeat protein
MRRPAPYFASLLLTLLVLMPAGRSADDGAPVRAAVADMERGDFPSAERKLRAELSAHPNDPQVLSLLGVALDNQKEFQEAGQFHRRAVAAAPRSADVLSNQGNHLLGAGDEKGAREAYLKAVAVDPAHPNANLQLARLALNQNGAAEALGQKNRKLASSDSAAPPAPSQKKKLTGFQRFQSFLQRTARLEFPPQAPLNTLFLEGQQVSSGYRTAATRLAQHDVGCSRQPQPCPIPPPSP